MANLSSIRERLSWKMLPFVVLYLAAALVFALWYLPARTRVRDLEGQLEQLASSEQMLMRVVEQIPQLEARKRQLEDDLQIAAVTIPSQYDLPGVLEGLRQLSEQHAVTLIALEHVPVQAEKGSAKGIIPLTMVVQGNEKVLSYLSDVRASLPSLRLTQVGLGYAGGNIFQLELEADLRVLMLDHDTSTRFEGVTLTGSDAVDVPVQAFGLPFELIAQYLGKHVQVLGIVNSASQRSALVSKDKQQHWLRVGDRLGEAVVKDITANAVVLDVDGVDIRLTIGG